MKPTQFIVVYDDNDCIFLPMQWSSECNGAVEPISRPNPIAVFPSRKEARKAINTTNLRPVASSFVQPLTSTKL